MLLPDVCWPGDFAGRPCPLSLHKVSLPLRDIKLTQLSNVLLQILRSISVMKGVISKERGGYNFSKEQSLYSLPVRSSCCIVLDQSRFLCSLSVRTIVFVVYQ